MNLCRELGGMTYFEMLDRMTSREVTMWKAYNELEKEDEKSQEELAKTKTSIRGR
jgi:hypothetical protein